MTGVSPATAAIGFEAVKASASLADDGLLPLHVIRFADEIAPATDLGVPGRLKWIPVECLHIDPRYQRPLHMAGRKNIGRIVRGFNWALFSPLVVAPRSPRPGHRAARFAIIDGQHRATAAKTHGGIYEVPCWVITGGPEVEARAFAIINGQVTAVLQTQIHAARVMGGEPDALALDAVCKAASVRILKTGNGVATMKVGDTMSIVALQYCMERYGRDTLITALQCVTETGDGNVGMLTHVVIRGLCAVLDGNRSARDAGEALFATIEGAGGIAKLVHRAGVARASEGGALTAHFIRLVRAALASASLGKVTA